jgi:signal transduction histidine kinase/ActR/RegA family two-component response regulator
MEGTTISLLDRNGTLIARSADADRYFGVAASPGQVRMMTERGETVSSFRGPDDVRRTFAIAAVRDPNGVVTAFATVGVPETNMAALLDPGGRREWLAVALLAVGLLVAAWLGSELLIRRPIAKLVTATGALAAGDLRVRTPPVGGVRELEGLASAFNQMAIKLQERDLHLREGQRLEAIGQLAGGIAHDFNNLLTVIMGYAEVLRESVDDASPEAAQLNELRAASQRAAQLTQQLLAFSRRQMLLPTPLQLNEVIGEMVSLLTRVTGGHVIIEVKLDPALGWVHADRVQMEQVVLNLVINARDAMPSGGRIVIETLNLVEAGAARVELSVSDTGVGMDAETRARIFEPFFTTKGLRGTGLGLATVYGIVKQSGGDVVCESEPGEGTRFRVTLPQHVAGTVGEPVRPAPPAGGSESILLVDDDAGVRAVLETMLGRRGYVVRSAANGAEALRWFEEGLRPDLVLTDVRMPGINGTSLAIKLTDYDPPPRIILMSGDAAPAMAGPADLGSAVFLQKPVTAPVLLRAVRDLLDQRPVIEQR